MVVKVNDTEIMITEKNKKVFQFNHNYKSMKQSVQIIHILFIKLN